MSCYCKVLTAQGGMLLVVEVVERRHSVSKVMEMLGIIVSEVGGDFLETQTDRQCLEAS